MFRFHY